MFLSQVLATLAKSVEFSSVSAADKGPGGFGDSAERAMRHKRFTTDARNRSTRSFEIQTMRLGTRPKSRVRILLL